MLHGDVAALAWHGCHDGGSHELQAPIAHQGIHGSQLDDEGGVQAGEHGRLVVQELLDLLGVVQADLGEDRVASLSGKAPVLGEKLC